LLGKLPIRTASGAVGSFNDGADDVPVKSLVANIDYKDTTGFNVVNVKRTGVNIWDEETIQGYYDNYGFYNSDPNYVCSKNPIEIKAGVSYFVVVPTNGTLYICSYKKSGVFIERTYFSSSRTFTPNSEAAFFKFNFGSSYGTVYNHDCSINYPSTDTTYHAYSGGKTVTINLNGTIYGGSVDITNGTVTSTKAQDGTDLPAPIGTTIDPTAINTLYGVNNIWSDTGDTSIEYRADIDLLINSLES
jgi:hypothetical protein